MRRAFITCLLVFAALAAPSAASAAPPPIKHVFVIALENKGFDETFGPNKAGSVETGFGGVRSVADQVVVQPDGKILVAGTRVVSGLAQGARRCAVLPAVTVSRSCRRRLGRRC